LSIPPAPNDLTNNATSPAPDDTNLAPDDADKPPKRSDVTGPRRCEQSRQPRHVTAPQQHQQHPPVPPRHWLPTPRHPLEQRGRRGPEERRGGDGVQGAGRMCRGWGGCAGGRGGCAGGQVGCAGQGGCARGRRGGVHPTRRLVSLSSSTGQCAPCILPYFHWFFPPPPAILTRRRVESTPSRFLPFFRRRGGVHLARRLVFSFSSSPEALLLGHRRQNANEVSRAPPRPISLANHQTDNPPPAASPALTSAPPHSSLSPTLTRTRERQPSRTTNDKRRR